MANEEGKVRVERVTVQDLKGRLVGMDPHAVVWTDEDGDLWADGHMVAALPRRKAPGEEEGGGG